MNNVPDGTNINKNCGATDPQALSDFVASVAASNSDGHSSSRLSVDLAFAFDGDGDRLIAVDELGNVVNGDRLIALSAIDRHQRGQLIGDGVVVTVMSNLGFHRAMEAAGIEVVTTSVGDRSVLEAMSQHGLVLGGEQSGHIIHRDLATTGDGLLAAIELARLYQKHRDRDGGAFSNLADSVLQWFPQVLRNVRITRTGVNPALDLAEAINAEEENLGRSGRILVRASGTEALVRVMVEADREDRAQEIAQRLVALVEAHYSST
jgi:phosphoglucosamine mutase